MRVSTHRIPGLIFTNHEFDLPLDHAEPDGERITVFAREIVALDKQNADLPMLVFLQGGPGFGSPRPMDNSGWIKRAAKDYRVLLLDQRGTGRSTTVLYHTLARLESPEAQADYLKRFRTESIIEDAELIRRELLGSDTQWSVLGQSYGGFCITHYLSAHPEGLKEVFITGGIPPVDVPIDDVYRATYRRVLERNRQYFERYPEDVELVRRIVNHLAENDVRLPGGGRLTPRRFQQLGLQFGMSDGFELVHYLLEEAFLPGASSDEPSYLFLRGVENQQAFDTNPIFAVLHEPIYCEGVAPSWSAQRVRAEYPQFESNPDEPVYFTGEMIYPWMFEDYAYLEPMKEAAHILAEHDGWSRLYDQEKLASNSVPGVAAVYYEDMYVEREFSEKTARRIPGIRTWVTNEYQHNGLRADGEKVLDRLLKMMRGEI